MKFNILTFNNTKVTFYTLFLPYSTQTSKRAFMCRNTSGKLENKKNPLNSPKLSRPTPDQQSILLFFYTSILANNLSS